VETTAPHLSPFVYPSELGITSVVVMKFFSGGSCLATRSRTRARFLLGNLDLALNSFSEQVLGDGFVPLTRECVHGAENKFQTSHLLPNTANACYVARTNLKLSDLTGR
jgi:hypothetical protein